MAEFKREGNPILYVQKLLPLPGRDLGVAFLGGEYLATYARQAGGDSWNTTVREGGEYAQVIPGDGIIELAERAQALFDLDFTSVDVAETEEGPMVFEVSAFGGFRGLMEGCEIDAAELYAEHVVARTEVGR